jgi:hypothetical protein
MKRRFDSLYFLLLSLVLVACATPGGSTVTVQPEPTGTVAVMTEVSPTETAVPATRTPPPVETAVLAGETPSPTETAAPPTEPPVMTQLPVETRPIPTLDPNAWSAVNPLHILLGSTPAPEGWMVQPCEGEAALLCISNGQQTIGAAELLINPLDTNPEFQAFLEEQGITPETMPEPGEAYETAVRAALASQAEQYLDIIEADRQITYPDDPFNRLESEPVLLGELPGLAFGFTREDASGAIEERYLNIAAYDRGVLYWLAAPYDPANVTTFTSDEALLEFEPYLREIAAGLRLPPPVVESDVEAVNVTARGVQLMAVYGQGPFGAGTLVEASQDEPYIVTGVSPDGRWWQVVCPEVLSGVCWLPTDPQRVLPATS